MGLWAKGEAIEKGFVKVDLVASLCTKCEIIMCSYKTKKE